MIFGDDASGMQGGTVFGYYLDAAMTAFAEIEKPIVGGGVRVEY